MRDEPGHPTRQALDGLLLRIADDLQHDEATQARFEQFKTRMLRHPELGDAVVSLWESVRASLDSVLEDPSSPLRAHALASVRELGDSLVDDEALRERVDASVSDAAGYLVSTYGNELSSVIGHTIQRWDGRDAARRIELYVGRDLQFIRINGTVVGALAGLVIHAVSQLL